MNDKHKLPWVTPAVCKVEVTEAILARFPRATSERCAAFASPDQRVLIDKGDKRSS